MMSNDEIEILTKKISNDVTKIVLATLQKTVADLVAGALTDVVPRAVSQVVDRQLPSKLIPMITEAMKPTGKIIKSFHERVTAIENQKSANTPTVLATEVSSMNGPPVCNYADAAKKVLTVDNQKQRLIQR